MSEMNAAQAERMFSAEEVERILDKRFARLNEKNEAQIRQAYAEGVEEGKRNAQYTPEGNYALERRERILQERERLVKERELQARAVEELKRRDLPAGLAKYVPCTDEESFTQGLETIDKCFREMLRKEIDKHLAASSVPLTRGGGGWPQPDPTAERKRQKLEDERRANAIIEKYK